MKYSRTDLIIMPRRGARFMGRFYPCQIGFGGAGIKKGEGDGISPVGRWHILQIYARYDRVKFKSSLPITPFMGWCDDVKSSQYNQLIPLPNQDRHEKLWRPDRLYDLFAVLNYNINPTLKNKGSAIFIHQWRRQGTKTAGCIAFSPVDLRYILQHLTPKSKIIIMG